MHESDIENRLRNSSNKLWISRNLLLLHFLSFSRLFDRFPIFNQKSFDIYAWAVSLLLNAANTEQSSLESDLEFITHHKVLGSDLNTDRLKVHSKMLPSVFRFVTIENKKLTVYWTLLRPWLNSEMLVTCFQKLTSCSDSYWQFQFSVPQLNAAFRLFVT